MDYATGFGRNDYLRQVTVVGCRKEVKHVQLVNNH